MKRIVVAAVCAAVLVSGCGSQHSPTTMAQPKTSSGTHVLSVGKVSLRVPRGWTLGKEVHIYESDASQGNPFPKSSLTTDIALRALQFYVSDLRPAGMGAVFGDVFMLQTLTMNGNTAPPETLRTALERSELETYRKTLMSAPEIDNGTPSGLEEAVSYALRRDGYRVWTTGGTGDQGADVVGERGTMRIVVQAKRWSKPAGTSAVQEVIAAKTYYNCNRAVVVAPSGFTKGARDLAGRAGVRLIGGEEWKAVLDGRTRLA